MKPLVKPIQGSGSFPPFSASVLMHALGRAVERFIGRARIYLGEHRKAKIAEEQYTNLSRLSGAELAKRGLRREQIAQLIKGRFCGEALAADEKQTDAG